MRVHRYPSLLGETRAQGLRRALTVSLVLHGLLFLAFARFHIRPVDRAFFAPLHMVDLVGPGPAGPGPTRAETRPAPPPQRDEPAAAAKPEPNAPPAEVKAKPEPPPPAEPKPKPAVPPAKPEPEPVPKNVPKVAAKPKSPPPDAKPRPEAAAEPAPKSPAPAEPERYSEERVAERIARLREKMGAAAAKPEPAPPATPADGSQVRRSIDSIRERLGSRRDGAGGGGSQRAGGGDNVLHQVRLRSYFNQLWDHVQRFWEIPPSLTGRGLVTILGVRVDRSGKILDVEVEEPSGSKAFDDAAVRALYRASPFPTPPDEIVAEGIGFRLTEKGVARGSW